MLSNFHSNAYPSLKLSMEAVNGRTVDFLVGPEVYFDGYDTNKLENLQQTCELKLKPFSRNDLIVLGRPFMQEYISMFNIETHQIGLIPVPNRHLKSSITQECSSNHFFDFSSYSCQKCHATCLTCFDKSTCLTCAENYAKVTNSLL